MTSDVPPPSVWRAMRDNLRAATLIAVVVGSVLLWINHGDHITREPICENFFAKCGLTYLVPFTVSMVSVVLARRSRRR